MHERIFPRPRPTIRHDMHRTEPFDIFTPFNEVGFRFRECGKHDVFHLSQCFEPQADLLVLEFFRIGICGGGGAEFVNSLLCLRQ